MNDALTLVAIWLIFTVVGVGFGVGGGMYMTGESFGREQVRFLLAAVLVVSALFWSAIAILALASTL